MRFILALILILTIGVAMSLHDVDKTNPNRITAVLNSADDVQQRMAQGTNQIQNAGEEDDSGLRTLERQILAVQDGTNKAVMGFYGDANKFGFKVAKDGIDVLTAGPLELIFNSENNVFKIVDTAIVPSPAFSPGTTQTTTIPHGLDYGPLVVGFLGTSTGFKPLPTFTSVGTGGGGSMSLDAMVDISSDDDNIYISTYSAGTTASAGFYTVRYYILQETAN
jgi:hypothetical protein